MLDADELVEVGLAADGVIRLGDAEAHVEVEGRGRAGVVDPGVDAVDLPSDRVLRLVAAGGGPPPRLKPFLGESTQMSGLKQE